MNLPSFNHPSANAAIPMNSVDSAIATTMVVAISAPVRPAIAATTEATTPESAAIGIPWLTAITPGEELPNAVMSAITAEEKSVTPTATEENEAGAAAVSSVPNPADWTTASNPQTSPAARSRKSARGCDAATGAAAERPILVRSDSIFECPRGLIVGLLVTEMSPGDRCGGAFSAYEGTRRAGRLDPSGALRKSAEGEHDGRVECRAICPFRG